MPTTVQGGLPASRPARAHYFHKSLKSEAAWSSRIGALFDLPGIVQVDVSKDRTFQAQGIDVLVRSGEKESSLDDKADSWRTGRMALEFVTKTSTGRLVPGWMLSSNMAWLRYGFTKTNDVLLVPMDELRLNLMPRLREFQPASAVNKSFRTNEVQHVTFSALVELKAVFDACPGAVRLQVAADPSAPRYPSLLPPSLAHRGVVPAAAVERMLSRAGRCAPLSLDLGQLWDFAVANDRMAAPNGEAVRSLG